MRHRTFCKISCKTFHFTVIEDVLPVHDHITNGGDNKSRVYIEKICISLDDKSCRMRIVQREAC